MLCKLMQTDVLQNTIIPGLINGDTQLEIAKRAGCHNSTISRWKDKLADQIELFQLQLIEQSGQKTVNNITATINRANTVLSDDDIDSKQLSDYKDLLQLSHKKEVLVGQAMGILPTNTQSLTINNLLSVHTGPNVSDIERIQELITMRQKQDIVDIDPESVSSKDDNHQSVNSND